MDALVGLMSAVLFICLVAFLWTVLWVMFVTTCHRLKHGIGAKRLAKGIDDRKLEGQTVTLKGKIVTLSDSPYFCVEFTLMRKEDGSFVVSDNDSKFFDSCTDDGHTNPHKLWMIDMIYPVNIASICRELRKDRLFVVKMEEYAKNIYHITNGVLREKWGAKLADQAMRPISTKTTVTKDMVVVEIDLFKEIKVSLNYWYIVKSSDIKLVVGDQSLAFNKDKDLPHGEIESFIKKQIDSI